MPEEQPIENNLPPEPPPLPPQPLPYLTSEERAQVMADVMRQESNLHDPISINKTCYRDVVDAVDTWISENMLAVENYIPEPGRSSLTMAQKARIFFAVTRAKIGNF